MNLVFFVHPSFIRSQSMPRFAKMLSEGMIKRGHNVSIWSPNKYAYRLPLPDSIRKWLGYIDQFIFFPVEVSIRIKRCPIDTLYIFTDQALGPWVPLVANYPHVIHCHDFLAQRSALGQISENPTSWTGRQYQSFIRSGYTKGKNFISVSYKTREDLHQFLPIKPSCSEVVYNGLDQSFTRLNPASARATLEKLIGKDLKSGYILHIGGNQWYKNRSGVINIYNAWRSLSEMNLPLLMIGAPPSTNLMDTYSQSPFRANIYLLKDITDKVVCEAYAGASVFLFPSLAEGFGWPIAEAMASGCPVITTDEAPMNDVAGNAALLIPRSPNRFFKDALSEWAVEAAKVIEKVLTFSQKSREEVIQAGLQNAKRFNKNLALDKIEVIYKSILKNDT